MDATDRITLVTAAAGGAVSGEEVVAAVTRTLRCVDDMEAMKLCVAANEVAVAKDPEGHARALASTPSGARCNRLQLLFGAGAGAGDVSESPSDSEDDEVSESDCMLKRMAQTKGKGLRVFRDIASAAGVGAAKRLKPKNKRGETVGSGYKITTEETSDRNFVMMFNIRDGVGVHLTQAGIDDLPLSVVRNGLFLTIEAYQANVDGAIRATEHFRTEYATFEAMAVRVRADLMSGDANRVEAVLQELCPGWRHRQGSRLGKLRRVIQRTQPPSLTEQYTKDQRFQNYLDALRVTFSGQNLLIEIAMQAAAVAEEFLSKEPHEKLQFDDALAALEEAKESARWCAAEGVTFLGIKQILAQQVVPPATGADMLPPRPPRRPAAPVAEQGLRTTWCLGTADRRFPAGTDTARMERYVKAIVDLKCAPPMQWDATLEQAGLVRIGHA